MLARFIIDFPGRLVFARVPGIGLETFEDAAILEAAGNAAVFLAVMEPFRESPKSTGARSLGLEEALGVEVEFEEAVDTVCYRPGGSVSLARGPVEFEGEFLFLRRAAGGAVLEAVGRNSRRLAVDGRILFEDPRPGDSDLGDGVREGPA